MSKRFTVINHGLFSSSDIVGVRKRTESYGAGSDSDVSDGWNFVEHVDTNQPDVPSSDGESVEVIEPDNESTEQGKTITHHPFLL